MNVINILVSGQVQVGKGAILEEIKEHLECLNIAVVYSSSEMRNNPPNLIAQSDEHERPDPEKTVVVLSEETIPNEKLRLSVPSP